MKLFFAAENTEKQRLGRRRGWESWRDDSWKSSSLLRGRWLKKIVGFWGKIGWHHQLPHLMSPIVVTPLAR